MIGTLSNILTPKLHTKLDINSRYRRSVTVNDALTDVSNLFTFFFMVFSHLAFELIYSYKNKLKIFSRIKKMYKYNG